MAPHQGTDVKPRVSVVMPVRDAGPYLREAVRSILDQDYRDLELLIVREHGSGEDIDSLLEGLWDGRLRVVQNTEPLGLAMSLNIGVEEARGEYVARMDADDVSDPRRIGKQARFLDEHKDVGVVGTQTVFIDPDGREVPSTPLPTTPAMVRWQLHFLNPIAHPTVMMRRDLIKELGGYSTRAHLCEDYELWLRAMRKTDLANLPEPLLRYRRHGGSVSVARAQEQRERASELAVRAIQVSTGRPVDRETALAIIHPYRIQSPKVTSRAAHLLYSVYRAYIDWNKLSGEDIMDVKWDVSERMSHILMRSLRLRSAHTTMVLWHTSRFGPGVVWRFATNVVRRGVERINGEHDKKIKTPQARGSDAPA